MRGSLPTATCSVNKTGATKNQLRATWEQKGTSLDSCARPGNAAAVQAGRLPTLGRGCGVRQQEPHTHLDICDPLLFQEFHKALCNEEHCCRRQCDSLLGLGCAGHARMRASERAGSGECAKHMHG